MDEVVLLTLLAASIIWVAIIAAVGLIIFGVKLIFDRRAERRSQTKHVAKSTQKRKGSHRE